MPERGRCRGRRGPTYFAVKSRSDSPACGGAADRLVVDVGQVHDLRDAPARSPAGAGAARPRRGTCAGCRCGRRCRPSARRCTCRTCPGSSGSKSSTRRPSVLKTLSAHQIPFSFWRADLAPGQLALQAPEPVDEEHAVQVVGLVAEGPGEEARPLDLADRPGGVGGAHPDPRRAHDLLGEVGNERQPSSSFCSPEASTTTGLTRTITRAGIGSDREVDDRDALVDADLGRGEADAGRRVAGLDHVGDEAGEVLARRGRPRRSRRAAAGRRSGRCRGSQRRYSAAGGVEAPATCPRRSTGCLPRHDRRPAGLRGAAIP